MADQPPAAPFHQRTELERAKHGWSKQELAARAKIGRVTYDRLAVNTAPPIARTVHKLCAVLDIDLAEGLRLAGLDTSPAPPGDGQPQFGSPDWQRQANEGFERVARQAQEGLTHASRQLGEAFGQMQRTMAAQGAMGWAYRGDLDQTRQALTAMGLEQLRELSAAASMLAALADEELSSR